MIILLSTEIFGQQISWLQFLSTPSFIFRWKSSSLSAVERYFSVVRPFNQLRNRFFFRFKVWPKSFFCQGFCDPPWRSPSLAFSSPSSSLSQTISCSPQCASKHNLHKLAKFIFFYPFIIEFFSCLPFILFFITGSVLCFLTPPWTLHFFRFALDQEILGRINFFESGSHAPLPLNSSTEMFK